MGFKCLTYNTAKTQQQLSCPLTKIKHAVYGDAVALTDRPSHNDVPFYDCKTHVQNTKLLSVGKPSKYSNKKGDCAGVLVDFIIHLIVSFTEVCKNKLSIWLKTTFSHL